MIRRNPPLRLLVVDDDAEVAEELAELLEAHGAQVAHAGEGPTALRLHAEQGFDLALIDLELGATSGVELALQWHCKPAAPAVLLLSGRALARPEAERFGTAPPPLFAKPIDLARLVAEVDRLFPTT